jgi:uncharacterized repeat protein (TIGR03806 family)
MFRRALLLAWLVLAACGGSKKPPCTPGGDGTYLNRAVNDPYPSLSQYCMVRIEGGAIVTEPGVLQYELNTPLFSDYAVKVRTLWLPPGKSAPYDPVSAFDFPDGTLITKSFGFRDDLRKPAPAVRWIETRVLLRAPGEWRGYAYAWDGAGQEATITFAGGVQQISWLDESGQSVTANYLVPDFNQCKQCHASNSVMTLLGTKARNLNRASSGENQLARFSRLGWLTGAPDPSQAPRLPVWNDPATGTVEQRARAYLEVNCAHCHSEGGTGRTSGLFLWASETSPARYGVCKSPVAAGEATGGFAYDIAPGDPDHSIFAYRMAATQPQVAMPQISRSVVDKQGLALVRQWIAGLPGACH